MGAFLYGVNMEPIKWIHTPATCKECKHYDKNKRRCGVKECPYPARRGGANIRTKA